MYTFKAQLSSAHTIIKFIQIKIKKRPETGWWQKKRGDKTILFFFAGNIIWLIYKYIYENIKMYTTHKTHGKSFLIQFLQ